MGTFNLCANARSNSKDAQPLNLEVKFVNKAQREFYYATQRNQCFSGGFNNGKSWVGCFKAFTLLATFPNYRFIIARQVYADLKRTTMETFFKICPPEFVASHNAQDGKTSLINGSQIFWLHLDNVDENTLRGIEPNSVFVDQAEEIDEKVYDVLDARVGRWDNAEIPSNIYNDDWPRNPLTGKAIAPSYMMLGCNPDTQYHFIYRKYHPDSLDRRSNYFYCEGEWDPNLGSTETYLEALKHDDEWVQKYVRGQWGISNAQIHRVRAESFLEPSPELLERIRTKGNLFRILDHGDSSPTCCLWAAAVDGVFIFFREYYVPNEVISKHRLNIHDLSGDEVYSGNFADPQIFKKTSQKDGGFWTVADEYLTPEISAPPIAWLPADNNEFATRNRINELLGFRERFKHPTTGQSPAPGIYFIKRTENYPNGCNHVISELQSQRRKLLGYVDGKAIYCDDREDSITDHGYDCVRYFVAMHGSQKTFGTKPPPRFSFAFYRNLKKREQSRKLVAASC